MRPTLKAFALASIFLAGGCASLLDQDGALAITPYRIEDDGLIVIEVNVNQQGPFRFALDTGATITSIFDSLRDELELNPVPGQMAIVHGAVAKGEFPILDVDQIAIGNESWTEPTVVSLPGKTLTRTGIKGVLGVDYLRQYAVGFSAAERVIRLYPPEWVAQRSYKGWAVVRLRAETVGESGAALYFFDVELDGHKISAAFDLGAGINLINWAAARTMGIRLSRSRSEREFSGIFEDMPISARLSAKTVKTANIRWRNEIFAIADLEIFTTLDLEDSPAAILGASLFSQRDFIIDLVRNRLLIKASMDEINLAGSE